MALPLKSGADLYNQQAIRMRLHNLGADPTEVGMGLIYFNTNTDTQGSNHSLHPCVYNGTSFKALAYVDDVANNAEFKALQDDVKLLKGDVDTDTLINNLKDLEEFLKGYDESDKLQSLLDGKLDKSGGTISGGLTIGDASNTSWLPISFNRNGIQSFIGSAGSVMEMGTNDGYLRVGGNVLTYITSAGGNALLHSGNIGSYNAGGLTAGTITDLNSITQGASSVAIYESRDAANAPQNDGTGNVIECTWYEGQWQTQIFATMGTAKLYTRGYNASKGTWSDWKTIAFTDSDITGYSAGLKHSNGTVGATVVSSGRVDFSGNISLALGRSILDPSGRSVFAIDGNNSPQIGLDTCGSYSTYINGKDVYLRYGSSRTAGLILNSSGNVTIGGSDQSTYKLYVAGTSYIDGNIYGNIANLKTIELTDSTPYIDFHYGNSTSDYTSRIVEDAEGRLALNSLLYVNKGGNVLIGTTNDDNSGAKLQVNGNISASGKIMLLDQAATPVARSVLEYRANNLHLGYDNRLSDVALDTYVNGKNVYLRYLGGNTGMVLNSSGYVLIGTTEVDSNKTAILQVKGGIKLVGTDSSDAARLAFARESANYITFPSAGSLNLCVNDPSSSNTRLRIDGTSGNVGIGTTEPKVPLDVMGSVIFGKSNSCNVYLRRNGVNYINAGYTDIEAPNASIAFTTGGKGSSNIALAVSNSLAEIFRDTVINGDLHVKGNIIADKEVSAGGAGEEGGSSSGGSGAFDTTTLTKGQSSYNVAHNLGTDNVIICIYEKSTSGTWEMILTDVEITDANNIKVTFGSATSVDHKVVIMGAVA